MNNSVRNFKNFVRWKLDTTEMAYENKYKRYEDDHFKELNMKIEAAKQNEKRKLILKIYNAIINRTKKKLRKVFDDNNEDVVKRINNLKLLLSYFDISNQIFSDYELLQEYLVRSKLNIIEQGEVLAYFVNKTICYYEENLDKMYHKIDTVETYIKDARRIITKEGELIAIANIDRNAPAKCSINFFSRDYVTDFTIKGQSNNSISFFGKGYITNYIVNASHAVAYERFTKETAKLREQDFKEKSKKAADEKFAKQLKQNKNAKVNEANIKNELKNYLDNDQPIKFMTDEEIAHVLDLLKEINYNLKQRNDIKRTILSYNQKCLEREKQEAFKAAEEKYLSPSELSLLRTVETILSNPEAIKNPAYYGMEKMYVETKAKLISLITDADDETFVMSDEVDYIMLCIEELTKLLGDYRSSNYKLNLTQNSN